MKTATFKIVILPVQTTPVLVTYTTEDDTALAGVDYVAKTGTFTLLPQQSFAEVQVQVANPVAGPVNKQFKLVLTEVNGNALLPVPPFGICILTTGDIPVEGGTIILNGLIANAWQQELGRGGYFHQNSGTSEGQAIGIEGSLLSFETLNGGTPEEQDAADWYLTNGKQMLDALGDGSPNSASLRIPVPSDPDQITLLHWLFAAKGDIPSQAINFTFKATSAAGKIIVPATVPAGPNGEAHKGGADLYRVWRIYPQTSTLLYNSPYSPAYDDTTPTGDTSVVLDEYQVDNDTSANWTRVGDTVEITLPGSTPPGITEWNVIYGYNNAGIIPRGTAQEAYPCWTKIPDGYSACAPDTFRWFDTALDLAITHDDRPGANDKWNNLRLASRKTAVRGQSLTDLREVLKPLPKFAAIALGNDEPTGMFCYSDHPSAIAPTPEQIADGANIDWKGYNFWSRVGGDSGSVAPSDFWWTPDVMFYPEGWTGDIFNGAIQCTVPAGSGAGPAICQTQIGRGFNDEWRGITPYQVPDQFVFVALETSIKPSLTEHFYVYLSTTKYYDGETRYYADIGQYADFQPGPSSDGGPRYFLIPRTEFKRKDSDNAVLPVGARFENFGFSAEITKETPFSFKIVALRIVSGPTPEWVTSNFQKAVTGGDMPFFPGAIPFATNAYMNKQQFVGFNGSPFHGYQLADFWWFCASEAASVHANLSVTDLAIPNAVGALTYPISATTTGSVVKPKHALLMEQQLIFLQQAQDAYLANGGPEGFFAHTFVLNTAARATIGNPTPHTWVYTNDDPNTRWTGYQTRILDALGRIAYLSKDDTGFLDARTLSITMAMKWLTRLNIIWPNLDGKPFTEKDSSVSTIYGLPTEYPDPRISPPITGYEEPHAAALILRSCMWLKASGKLSSPQLSTVEAVGKRCFDYLELRWREEAGDQMQYTWANKSPLTGANEYFGFWVFEILSTLNYLLKYPSGVPTGVDTVRVREWITKHKLWLVNNVQYNL